MKKTLITSLLLCAGLASAATLETVVNGEPKNDGFGNYMGWTISLAGSYMNSPEALPETVQLDAISIKTPGGTNGNNVKLAIFEINNDGNLATCVGLSDQSLTFTADSYYNYTFSSTTLTSSTVYAFRFVQSTATMDSIAENAGNLSGILSNGRIRMTNDNGNLDAPLGVYDANGSRQAGWLPTSTYTLTVADKPSVDPTPNPGNVPEPATATLSLLALAGLAARRRRK